MKLARLLGCLTLAAALAWAWPLAAPAQADQPELDLEALVREAAAQNPELQAAVKKWEALSHKPAQAAALDDPMLSLGLVNVPSSLNLRSEDMTMTEVGISQKLPFPGKRALMSEMASQEAQAARQEVAEKTNQVTREIKQAYLELSHLYRALEVARQNQQVLEGLAGFAQSRYALGQASQGELLKAQVEVSRMLDEIIMMEQRQKAVRARLASLAARPPEAALGRPADPLPRRLAWGLAELRQAALDHNPTLKAMRNMLQAKTTAQDLAQAEYYPDFNLRLAYGFRDNAEDYPRRDLVTGMVEINLPIWRETKLERKRAESKAEAEGAQRRWQAMQNEIFYMLAETHAMLERNQRQVDLYQSGILPQARLQAASSLRTYAGGKGEFMPLLESQMALYKFELEYHQALTDQAKNLAALEALVGRPLPARGEDQ